MADQQQVPVSTTTASGPAPTPAGPVKPGPIDNRDIDDWKNQFNAALADTKKLTAPPPADRKSWTTKFFGCFSPIDTCAITCCLPCVTFGKIHHRVRKNPTMADYEPVNTSCLLFLATSCVGFSWVLALLQRMDIREKYGLSGDFITDLAAICCCGCCALIQEEKETELLVSQGAQQYSNKEAAMAYPA